MDVDGVEEVTISYRKQIAVVRFDDARTAVPALTQATADMGFPSTVMSPGGD
jgi:mercuric ion binding protein